MPKSNRSYNFDENATYVIAGGLGGLGRSIVRWMIGRKARNLILLSRSSLQSEAVSAWVSELKTLGVEIATPACDISDSNSLMSVLAKCRGSMPPIKGCIQGAMVLKVGFPFGFPSIRFH